MFFNYSAYTVLISVALWLASGSVTKPSPVVKMPAPIERCVRKQNVLYLHNRNQFSAEYFRFMRRLLLCNIPHGQQTVDEKLVSLIFAAVRFTSAYVLHLLCRFLKSIVHVCCVNALLWLWWLGVRCHNKSLSSNCIT